MKPEMLMQLLLEVEKEDPVDFTGLPFDANDLRQLACLNVVEIINSWPDDASHEAKDMLMAATITRLVLENMALQARLAILLQDASPEN